MSITIPKLTITSQRLVLDNEKLRRANGKVTAGTAYNYGDLLSLSDDNVLTHAADESSWDVICGQNPQLKQPLKRLTGLKFQCTTAAYLTLRPCL